MRRRGRRPPAAAGAPAELPSGSPMDSIEAALGVIPPRPSVPLPRWLGPLAVCCLIGFLPWIVYLGLTLPRRARADHYDLAWLGFDCAMWLVLAALAFCAVRRRPATGLIAAVACTMLLVDAWFDVVTTEGDGQFVVAVLLAVFAEIPLAIICGWTAVYAERVRARAYRGLHSRWQTAIGLVHAARRDAGAPKVSDRPTAPPPR